MTNPLGFNTRSLIASQMASLFNLSDDLARMIVFYPSDPVLAMACRNLTNQMNNELLEDKLFCQLEELFESLQADRAQSPKIIGTMMTLKPIDAAPNVRFPDNHSYFLNDDSQEQSCDSIAYLKNKLQDFGDLWEKKEFVLEPPEGTESSNTRAVTSFPDYQVVTVHKFLETLLPVGEFDKMKESLPKTTLFGLVNASHSVKLIRTRNGFVFKEEQIGIDDRIDDKNCNLIDDALLKLGLAHQCCFLMPDRYYRYDLIVPVL